MLGLSAFLWTLVVAVLPLPAEGPAVANALLFSAPLAIALTWAGCLCGAAISFEVSRRGGRPLAKRWLRPAAIARVDRAVLGVGWLGLLGLRLLPAVSFTGINWAAGLAPVSRPTFYWTTALGIFPGCIGFTFLTQRGAPLLPEGLAPALGAMLVAVALVRWAARRIPVARMASVFSSWIAPRGPASGLALRFRIAAVGGVALAACLALAAPDAPPRGAPLVSAHCSGASPEGPPACCPLTRTQRRG